jgi:hypothetical protein
MTEEPRAAAVLGRSYRRLLRQRQESFPKVLKFGLSWGEPNGLLDCCKSSFSISEFKPCPGR